MEKILVIQLSRMGDLIQSLPLLQRLKESSTETEITLVCLREFRAILDGQHVYDRLVALELADVHKLCDAAGREMFWQLSPFKDIPELRETYDRIINLTHDEGSAVLSEKINGREKSGRIHTFPNEIRLLGDWAKYFFAAVKNRRLNLFNLVDIYQGIGGVVHRPSKLRLEVDGAAQSEAFALLRQHGYAAKGQLVGLQMGASDLRRAWPAEKFAALAHQLCRESGVEIVLFGSPSDAALSREFLRLADCPAINLIGETSVQQLPALLKRCDLLVSNDTGPLHVAAAVGARVVGLYFATAHFAETAPYGEGHVVLQVEGESSSSKPGEFSAASRNADFLPVDAALAVARQLLGRGHDWPLQHSGLAIYQSRFLANGTLSYVPMGKASDYAASGVSRLMWEKALGISTDPFFAKELLRHVGAGQDLEGHLADLRPALLHLRRKFSEGSALAGRLAVATSSHIQPGEPSAALHDQITQTVKEISGLGQRFGLLADFFHYEMMDLDLLPKPALGDELGRKFGKLERLSKTFLETLDWIETLGRS